MSTVPRRRFLAQLAGAGVITPALTFPEILWAKLQEGEVAEITSEMIEDAEVRSVFMKLNHRAKVQKIPRSKSPASIRLLTNRVQGPIWKVAGHLQKQPKLLDFRHFSRYFKKSPTPPSRLPDVRDISTGPNIVTQSTQNEPSLPIQSIEVNFF